MHYVYVNFSLTNLIDIKRCCKFEFLIFISKKIKLFCNLQIYYSIRNPTLEEVGEG